MSYDTFMEKLGNEVQPVNSSYAKGYFPNINFESAGLEGFKSECEYLAPEPEYKYMDEMEPLELGSLFMEEFNAGTKLSDGRLILKKQFEGGSKEHIENIGNGRYKYTSSSIYGTPKTKTRIMSEKELLADSILCTGTVKKIGEDKYEVKFYTDCLDSNSTQETFILDSMECYELLERKNMCAYT